MRLTIVSVPKPFEGDIGRIQRNAIRSWQLLGDVDVVLMSDEAGVAEAATELGVRCVADIARNTAGTPRLDAVLERAQSDARTDTLVYVNADILLSERVVAAVATVAASFDRYLVVGQCRNVRDGRELRTREQIADVLATDGALRGSSAVDFFVFPTSLYDAVPPLAIGRGGFDNWLLWRARANGAAVVDITPFTTPVHQDHDYAHVAGGKLESYIGAEAAENVRLAGGKRHLHSLHDATHRLSARGLRRNPAAFLRMGDLARRVRWKLGLGR